MHTGAPRDRGHLRRVPGRRRASDTLARAVRPRDRGRGAEGRRVADGTGAPLHVRSRRGAGQRGPVRAVRPSRRVAGLPTAMVGCAHSGLRDVST